jgi:hypothetical protein
MICLLLVEFVAGSLTFRLTHSSPQYWLIAIKVATPRNGFVLLVHDNAGGSGDVLFSWNN